MDREYPCALPVGSKARQDFLEKGKMPKGFTMRRGEIVQRYEDQSRP